MIISVFSVYDSKVDAFLQPFFMQTKGAAVRALSEIVSDPKHQFAKHSSDYTLFELGRFDDSNATFELHKTPLSLGLLHEFLKPRDVSPI